jgi:predicted Zn-dependent peptidase
VRYPIHSRVLDNGLTVVVSPDPSAPSVAVNLWYDVGSRDEAWGQFGWAHLFEHLMFQGSANVGSGEHLNALQSVGGVANATTWFDRTNYFETVPTGALDLALWLEADRLETLPDALDQANLDTQRDVVKEEKRQRYDNQPYGDAMEHLVRLAFPDGHPYAHTTIGSMADLDLATPDGARDFFRRHYRPDNAVLTLVGDVKAADGFKKAEKYLGRVPRPGDPGAVRPEQAALPPLTGGPRQELARGDIPADAINLVWRAPARDSAECDAVEAGLSILADGPASRLEKTLVRERQLAAAVSASLVELAGGNSLALLSVHVMPGVDPAEAEQALVDAVGEFASGGPTLAELDRAKAAAEREWLTTLADFSSRADQLSCYATFDSPERVNSRLDQRLELATADVRVACAEHIDPAGAGTLVYLKEDADG